MKYQPTSWLPFLDLLIIFASVKAVRLSRTYPALITYSTIASVFLYLLASDLSSLTGPNTMDFLFDWPARGYFWRAAMLVGLIMSIMAQATKGMKDGEM